MSKFEELTPNAAVCGILPDALSTVFSVQWFGSEALELTYKSPSGKLANELLYRNDESRFEVVEQGRPWSFDGEGRLFRLVSEAYRIQLAHLFDPVLAVHTSVLEPLPHQITAVYEVMLPRQPLRFLLADDPGAGKTIMAGLLMKELIACGDLHRCLVVCPGSLAEQWQDELYRRFHLPFEILTNDKLEAAGSGNWFLETNLVIARLDKLLRNEDVKEKLKAPDCRWDLIVCDEAHKMSASIFGGEVKYTKRYKLGQLLSTITRHFLLMTATPHNGKEADFQLFMALLDGDRFDGRFRDGVHVSDVSDLMRWMVKEGLLKFDATPLFPERIAYTVPYKLSNGEALLYKEVTDVAQAVPGHLFELRTRRLNLIAKTEAGEADSAPFHRSLWAASWSFQLASSRPWKATKQQHIPSFPGTRKSPPPRPGWSSCKSSASLASCRLTRRLKSSATTLKAGFPVRANSASSRSRGGCPQRRPLRSPGTRFFSP